MSISTFILGLFVLLESAPRLGWFAVDTKFLGFVGIAFVVCLIIEAIFSFKK